MFSEGGHKEPSEAAFLAAEGVKRSGRSGGTEHAAGPALAGPLAPLIRPSHLQILDMHFFRVCRGNRIAFVLNLSNEDVWTSNGMETFLPDCKNESLAAHAAA